jgi:hypothetical protein
LLGIAGYAGAPSDGVASIAMISWVYLIGMTLFKTADWALNY